VSLRETSESAIGTHLTRSLRSHPLPSQARAERVCAHAAGIASKAMEMRGSGAAKGMVR